MFRAQLNIERYTVGSGEPLFLIAEVAQAHGGSLAVAHEYIEAVADSGFDAIKFQTHIAEYESTLDEPFRIPPSEGDDEARYDYWKRMEFDENGWRELSLHAKERELVFLSSAFSVEAVRLLQRVGVPAWKVGSGEFRSSDVMAAIAESHLPVILSTGMMNYAEITRCVDFLRNHKVAFALMQCTSSYPTKLEDVGLNIINELKERYGCPVGLSDHSGSVYPGLAAIYSNAALLEVHVKLSSDNDGPDASSSLLPAELKLLADARESWQIMRKHPVNKDAAAQKLATVRTIFTKSVATVQDLAAGTVLESWMLTLKKPGGGFQFDEINRLVGRRLVRNVSSHRILRREDVEL